MFFWLLFLMSIAAFVVIAVCLAVVIFETDGDVRGGSGVIAFFVGIVLNIPLAVVWSGYAEDRARVVAQHHRIEVYEERVTSLEQRLNEASYPDKSVVSLDADTPWATMMRSLTKAETELARAKDERAKALRDIEATRYGPWSGVVWFVGDIPDSTKGEDQ